MVGMVTKRVRIDMRMIRIFNRMLIIVIFLNRIVINLKWMVKILIDIEGIVIRMSIIRVSTVCKYMVIQKVRNVIEDTIWSTYSSYEQDLANLGCLAFLFKVCLDDVRSLI